MKKFNSKKFSSKKFSSKKFKSEKKQVLINLSLSLALSTFSVNALADRLDNINNFIGLDSAVPFGTLSKNQMPSLLLKNQNDYSSPITLGGQIQPDLQDWSGSYHPNNYPNGSKISLSHTYLFTYVSLNDWVHGFVSYTNTGYDHPNIGRAFLLLGDYSKTPFYITLGDAYLPFGVFSANGPLNNTLPTNLFRVSSTDQISFNYAKDSAQDNLLINTAIFRNSGALKTGAFTHSENLADFLINGNYTYHLTSMAPLSFNIGGGYLNDIRGLKSSLGKSFSADSPSATQPLTSQNSVSVYDINGGFTYDAFSLLFELDSTIHPTQTSTGSLSNLSAYDIAGTYSFKINGKPTKAVLSYSHTQNMALINMPLFGDYDNKINSTVGMRSSWLGSLQYEISKNIYMGPELNYANFYNQTHSWTSTLDLTAYF